MKTIEDIRKADADIKMAIEINPTVELATGREGYSFAAVLFFEGAELWMESQITYETEKLAEQAGEKFCMVYPVILARDGAQASLAILDEFQMAAARSPKNRNHLSSVGKTK